MKRAVALKAVPALLRLDLGCGDHKREGFLGVDITKTASTDVIYDLLKFPWPWKSASVEEIHISHFFEHVPGTVWFRKAGGGYEVDYPRFAFMDECYRIMVDGAKMTIICPYWSSVRSIQDPTHCLPGIAENSFLYFNKQWRADNKLSHYQVNCDFDFGYLPIASGNPYFAGRSAEFMQAAALTMNNAVDDIMVTLTKRPQEP